MLIAGICFYMRGAPRAVAFDIKPGSCPNPLNINVKGADMVEGDEDANTAAKAGPGTPYKTRAVLTVAILGTEDFDVSDVDMPSVKLKSVSPVRWGIQDIAAPVSEAIDCECTSNGPDGFDD